MFRFAQGVSKGALRPSFGVQGHCRSNDTCIFRNDLHWVNNDEIKHLLVYLFKYLGVESVSICRRDADVQREA